MISRWPGGSLQELLLLILFILFRLFSNGCSCCACSWIRKILKWFIEWLIIPNRSLSGDHSFSWYVFPSLQFWIWMVLLIYSYSMLLLWMWFVVTTALVDSFCITSRCIADGFSEELHLLWVIEKGDKGSPFILINLFFWIFYNVLNFLLVINRLRSITWLWSTCDFSRFDIKKIVDFYLIVVILW